MTIHRATAIVPVPSASRELSVSNGSPRPARAGGHAINGIATSPTGAMSGDGAPVEVAERYLAPAMKAVAAARERTARIRAAAWAAAAGPARPSPSEWPVEPVAQTAAAQPPEVQSPAAQPPAAQSPEVRSAAAAPSPTPAPVTAAPHPAPEQGARMAAAVAVCGPAVAGPAGSGGLPAMLQTRGLSVAEAARASKISFHPLRRRPALPEPLPAKPAAAPGGVPRLPGKRPAGASTPANGKPAVPAVAPANAVTRPGSARLLPAEATRPIVPERPQQRRRFTKTVADLQRHQAETRPSEPWGNVVPRPAVPQSSPASTESRWTRLWSRR